MSNTLKRNLYRAAVFSIATAGLALPVALSSTAMAATPSATANSYTTTNGTKFSVDRVTNLKQGDTIKLTVSNYTPPTDKNGFYFAYGPDSTYSYLDASVYPTQGWVSKKAKNEPTQGGSSTIEFQLTDVKNEVSDCTQTACSLYIFSAHGGKDRSLDARIRLHLANEKDTSDTPPTGFVVASADTPNNDTKPADTKPADTKSEDQEPDLGFFASISAIFSTIFNVIIGLFKAIFGIFGF